MTTPKPTNHIAVIRCVIGLMTVQTAVLIAGVPWAFKMHGAVASITTKIEGFVPAAELTKAEDHVALKVRVAVLETKIAADEGSP